MLDAARLVLYEAADRYEDKEFENHLAWRRYLDAEGMLYRFEQGRPVKEDD